MASSMNDMFFPAGTCSIQTNAQQFDRLVVPEDCELVGFWLNLSGAGDAMTTFDLMVNNALSSPVVKYRTPASYPSITGIYIGADKRLELAQGTVISLRSDGNQVAAVIGYASYVLRR
jgi:hypothetical protein